MVLAMAEIFALLLGEIDLSIGYVGAVGAVDRRAARAAGHDELAVVGGHHRRPRWRARSSAPLQGTLITRLRLPSFIVTLAGLLIFNGVLLIVLGLRAVLRIPEPDRPVSPTCDALYDLMWGHVSPARRAGSSWRSSSARSA